MASSLPLIIATITLLPCLYAKLNMDGVTPDYPKNWKTEIERVQHKWDKDQKKWFDYIFDPHYDVTFYGLHGGTDIPALGINTKFSTDTDDIFEILVFAMRLGYRFFHTDLSYNNFEHIARAIGAVGLRRSSLFLSLTVSPEVYGYRSTINAVRAFAKEMELKAINLCLMNGPEVILNKNSDDRSDEELVFESAVIRRLTWMALESLKEDGICQNLGVSHFEKKHIEELMGFAKWKPAVNMMEYHPYNLREKLKKYMVRERMTVISENVLNPSGDGTLLKEKVVRELADKYSKTPSQIILKWAEQQAIIALPSDSRKQRVADNAQIFSFKLEYNDISKINELNRGQLYGRNFENVEAIKWNKRNEGQFEKILMMERREMMQEHTERYRAHKEAQRNKDEL